MQAIGKTLSIGFLLFLFVIVFVNIGCKKSEEDDSYISPEPELHYGWHESMSGSILFTGMLEGSNREYIFIIDKDDTKQIAHPDFISSIDGGIEWSPDKTKIAFANYNDGLFVMENDGTNAINLYDEHDCRSPSWSPDGSLIACVDWGKNVRICDYVSGINNFIELGYGIQSLDWRPTGIEILVFKSPYMQTVSLLILDVSDNTIVDIYDGQAYYPVWSPDGQKIAFVQNGSYTDEFIYMINADGSDIKKVINFHDHNLIVHCGDLTWSPDGSMIAAGSHDGIYVIDLNGTIITKISVKECHSLDWQ